MIKVTSVVGDEAFLLFRAAVNCHHVPYIPYNGIIIV